MHATTDVWLLRQWLSLVCGAVAGWFESQWPTPAGGLAYLCLTSLCLPPAPIWTNQRLVHTCICAQWPPGDDSAHAKPGSLFRDIIWDVILEAQRRKRKPKRGQLAVLCVDSPT